MMKKSLFFLAVALLSLPVVSRATRIEIPGTYMGTQVNEMSGGSGVVSITIICGVSSGGICFVMNGIPVLPPVIQPAALPTFSHILQNTNVSIVEPFNDQPVYTGRLNSIQVNPTVLKGVDANQINLFFQPEIEN